MATGAPAIPAVSIQAGSTSTSVVLSSAANFAPGQTIAVDADYTGQTGYLGSPIAGAYLTIARAGTALGANRHHRDWARLSSRLLIFAGPLALHSAFDFPLLALQKMPDLDPTLRMWLGGASLLIGFSSIAFAIRLVRRVARHHAPRTDIARERLSQLRRMWALLLAGGGIGFLGLAFVLTSIHHWLINPERNLTLALIPIGFVSILLGLALLVVTTAIYILGRNRIRTTGEGFSSAHGSG